MTRGTARIALGRWGSVPISATCGGGRVRAMYWSIRRRGFRRRWDAQWTHFAAEAVIAAGLLVVGLGVSRLVGVSVPGIPVLGAAGRAIAGLRPASADSGPASAAQEVRADIVAAPAGRAVLIIAGGHAALIDGGPPAVGEAIVARLRALGIDRVDVAAMTQGGDGEALGLLPVLDAMPVGALWDLTPGNTCPAHQAVLADARAHGTKVTAARRGQSATIGAARLDVVWPAADVGQEPVLPSQAGLVRLSEGDVRVLWAGNIQPAELNALQRLGNDLSAQVLELPAGGGPGALGLGFLHAVGPRVAIVDPVPGGPDPQVLQRLAADRVVTVEAAESADLRVQTDGHGLVLAFDPGLPGQQNPDSTTTQPAHQGSASTADPCA